MSLNKLLFWALFILVSSIAAVIFWLVGFSDITADILDTRLKLDVKVQRILCTLRGGRIVGSGNFPFPKKFHRSSCQLPAKDAGEECQHDVDCEYECVDGLCSRWWYKSELYEPQ